MTWLEQAQERGLIVKTTGANPAAVAKVGRIKGIELSEAEFQEAVIGYAQEMGYKVAHFRKVRVQRKDGSVYWQTPVAADGAGFPDLLIVGRGRVFAMELKKAPNKPEPAQLMWIEAMKAAGLDADVYYTDELDRILEKLR